MNRLFLVLCLALSLFLSLFLSRTANALTIHYGDDRQAELVACDQHAYVGDTEKANECYKNLSDNEDPLVKANAAASLGYVREANKQFREASSSSTDPIIKTHWAMLYLKTHQVSDAMSLLREALLYDEGFLPARLGLIEATMRTYESAAREQLGEILAEFPENVHALMLLARMELELQNTEQARQVLANVKPLLESAGLPLLEWYTLQAGANLLDAEPIDSWAAKALAENPSYGDIYSDVAHYYIITYRYVEAVELYKKAVDLNPLLAPAQRDLGINYLRINNVFGARHHIQKAFDIDPYDAQTVNTLRLLDKLDGMRISSVDVPDPDNPGSTLGRVIIRLDREDADALEPYVQSMSIEAMQVFSKRYDFKLKQPMIVELYHDHDDFGVRTVSTPGIGLLGVTFGHLTAMDSPKARAINEFHWGSTLWHEIAHVITLSATSHLLPRWFSEGLSVYEEWNTGPLNDRTIPMATLLAIAKNQLLPIDSLDSGFVRPTYNGQVQVSYMQAGLICDFISQRWGHEALVVMLKEFAQRSTTSDALVAAIGIDGPTFDTRFNEYIEERYGELSRSLDDYQVAMRQMGRAIQSEDWLSVSVIARNVIERYPENVADGNAYEVLAKALRERDDNDGALDILMTWHKLGGHGLESMQWMARELRDQKRFSEAAVVMESINWVSPYVVEEHRWLGDYYLSNHQTNRAIREYDALLGLRPDDPAEALLGKAKAAMQMGDEETAKRQVLYALEHAPFYRSAQKLLLEFNEGESVD